ncbi:MAG: NifB/NifX family molybdenum-iron cluster-binding protein [Bacteroidales bacterium]|nr:dinitrogenase iron-molybdenum cofactor biosynthesis protein [Bacteroidales bacterium]
MMKIAVPVKDDYQIDSHFGHCAFYQIFTITDQNEVMFVETTDSPEGCGCKSNMAEILAQKGVKVMLAGGIGTGAINKLKASGIEVIRNCEGNARQQVLRYLAGELKDGGSSCSSHDHGHECSHNH